MIILQFVSFVKFHLMKRCGDKLIRERCVQRVENVTEGVWKKYLLVQSNKQSKISIYFNCVFTVTSMTLLLHTILLHCLLFDEFTL